VIVAVLSDIHSNLHALQAVLDSLGTVDAVWHLGDVVGYGPEPDGVVEALEGAGAIGVRGNHDHAACGKLSLADFNSDARAAAEWTRLRIAPRTREYLEALPEKLTPAGTPFTLAHGSPRDPIWEYVFTRDVAAENLTAFQTPYCLIGHTHVPLVFRDGRHGIEATAPSPGASLQLDERRLLINPGSVGQPRDGDPTASYAVLDTAAGTVTWLRVAYDIEATQAEMHAAGLPGWLSRRLSFGQ